MTRILALRDSRSQFFFSRLSLAAAFLLLAALGARIATRLDLWHWWVPLACVGGVAAADFVSGLIHWIADTWGRDDLPVIGRRLLVPSASITSTPTISCGGASLTQTATWRFSRLRFSWVSWAFRSRRPGARRACDAP